MSATSSTAIRRENVKHETLARRLAHEIACADAPSATVNGKVKLCLLDLVGCAFESRDLPWSRQATALGARVDSGGATIIGAPFNTTFADAAFANAVMGHGLVREDMHSGSISHLGIVVLPTLLALSQYRPVSGTQFIAAAAAGYEVGGRIGRALMDASIARIHRPTGMTGPVAAAAAGARLLHLSEDATTSAIALGANAAAGFNQWAHTGGSEMFFHAGFAARNALTAVRLAESGAFASPEALDGEAGLFAALGKRANAAQVTLFASTPEILSVYHKPVPACNFAQTPVQAALAIARDKRWPAENIAAIEINVPRAGALYPGCDYRGPFDHVLQAKMSIQYNVAAALIEGAVTERNFSLLNDALLQRLIARTTLSVDDALTHAYPAQQGAQVEVHMNNGESHRVRLGDVVNAGADEVRARFRASAEFVIGQRQARELEAFIDTLDKAGDVAVIGAMLRAHTN